MSVTYSKLPWCYINTTNNKTPERFKTLFIRPKKVLILYFKMFNRIQSKKIAFKHIITLICFLKSKLGVYFKKIDTLKV